MTDDLESAVDSFLDAADDALAEYDRGYTDADATVRRLESELSTLREAIEQ